MTYGDGSAYDSSVFSFNPVTRVFSVSTSDVSKVGLYTLKMTGYIIDPAKFSSITFTVDIRDNCENVVITPATA